MKDKKTFSVFLLTVALSTVILIPVQVRAFSFSTDYVSSFLAAVGTVIDSLFSPHIASNTAGTTAPIIINRTFAVLDTQSSPATGNSLNTVAITNLDPRFTELSQQLGNIDLLIRSLSRNTPAFSGSISRAEVMDLISGSLSHTSTSIGNSITNITNNTTAGTDSFAALTPTYGQVLVGNVLGGFTLTATSSLGISSGGASQWTTSGSDIYFTGGNVAIGTTTPQYPLGIYKLDTGNSGKTNFLNFRQQFNNLGDSNTSDFSIYQNGSISNPGWVIGANKISFGTFDGGGNINFGTSTTGRIGNLNIFAKTGYFSPGVDISNTGGFLSSNGLRVTTDTSASGQYVLSLNSGLGEVFLVQNDGTVGIGTSSPGQKLSVAGDILGNKIIGSYFAGTSTATSTFLGSLQTYKTLLIGGGAATNGQGTGGFAIGNTNDGVNALATASGVASFAGGTLTAIIDGAHITSSGSGSIAYGYVFGGFTSTPNASSTILSAGNGSVALGNVANNALIMASGAGSFAGGAASGGNVTSTGSGSFAWGDNVSATANYAFALGTGFTNSTASTFQVGYSSNPTLTVTSTNVGIGTTSPYSMLSVAGQIVANNIIATSTTATSTFANDISVTGTLAIGRANGSVIIGATTGAARGSNALDIQVYRQSTAKIASGSESIALGHNNVASALVALAIGHSNTVSATYATAVGYLNTVDVNYGSVFGRNNTSSGVYGVALGYNNTVTGANSIAIGNTVSNAVDTSLMIGPSDASKLTILGATGKVGFTGIGTSTPWGLLSINPTAALGTAPQFVVGSSTATSLIISNAGNVGIGVQAPGSRLAVTDNFSGSAGHDSVNLVYADTWSGNISASVKNGLYVNSSVSGTISSAIGSLINLRGTYSQLLFNGAFGGNGGDSMIETAIEGIANFTGTIGGAGDSVAMYGGNFSATGNLGTTPTTSHTGIAVGVLGTADNNYGVFISSVTNGTNNYALYVQATAQSYFAGNVGIGTTTPWAKFSINPVAGDGATPSFVIGSTTATKFIVANTGYVGLSTTTPSAKLSIKGDGTTTGRAFTISNSGDAEKLTVLDNGRVGIGTTSLSSITSLLTIQSGSGSFSTDDSVLKVVASSGGTHSTNYTIISATSSIEFNAPGKDLFGVKSSPATSADFFSNATNNYAFYASPSGGVTDWGFYSTGEDKNYFSGNVGLASTTPGARLAILQTVDTNAGGFMIAASDGDTRAIYMDTSGVMHFLGAGSASTDATLTAGGTWTNGSDRIFKTNIQNLNYGLSDLMKLQPRSYSIISNGEKQIGFIAQEMETVIPEVVSGEEGHKGIAYGNLVTLTVSSIQDISKILNIQTSSTTALTSLRLDTIESRLSKLEGQQGSVVGNIMDLISNSITATVGMFDTVHVKKGIEIESQSGQVYCVQIDNMGNWLKNPGSCASQNQNPPGGGNIPPVVPPTNETTSSTTPPVIIEEKQTEITPPPTTESVPITETVSEAQ